MFLFPLNVLRALNLVPSVFSTCQMHANMVKASHDVVKTYLSIESPILQVLNLILARNCVFCLQTIRNPFECIRSEIKHVWRPLTCKFPAAHVWFKLKTGFPLCRLRPGAVNGDESFFVSFLVRFNLWMACLSCFLWNKSSEFDFPFVWTGILLLFVGNGKASVLKPCDGSCRRFRRSFKAFSIATKVYSSQVMARTTGRPQGTRVYDREKRVKLLLVVSPLHARIWFLSNVYHILHCSP